MTQTVTPLSAVVDIYSTLHANAKLEIFPGNEGTLEHASPSAILEFLEGYRNDIKYELKIYDFHEGQENDELYNALFNHNSKREEPLLRSFNKIYKKSGGAFPEYVSEVHLDTHNKYCWARFCTLKEACHILFIIEAHENKDTSPPYPYTKDDEKVKDLLQATHTLPFSLLDFGTDGYPAYLKIENAAEVLAYFLMVGHEQIARDRLEFCSLKKEKRGIYDFLRIAKRYNVTRRYAETFFKDKFILREIIKNIEKATNVSAFDAVHAPPASGPENLVKNSKN